MPTTASWISKQPGRCGGEACVRDTRIPVWGVVAYRRLGMTDEQILQAVQGLTPADLEAAWSTPQPTPTGSTAPSARTRKGRRVVWGDNASDHQPFFPPPTPLSGYLLTVSQAMS